MFFVGLDIHIGVNQVRLNLLPAALGWFWMFTALGAVVQLSPMFVLLRRLAVCLIVLNLPFVIEFVPRSNPGVVRWNGIDLSSMDYWSWGWTQWSSLALLMSALYFWCLGGMIIKLALSKDNQWLAVRARFRRILYVVPVVLIPWLTALIYVSWATVIGVLILYGLIVFVAVFYYAALTSLVCSFCREQAFASDGMPPDFSGKESSALEDALLTDDPQKPFRFSLWTLILFMAVIGMASSQINLIWTSQQSAEKLITAQEEIDFYIDQLDELRVYDTDKLYVRHVPVFGDTSYEWRVHVPKQGMYQLCVKFSGIPREGVPDKPVDIVKRLRGGESIIKLDVEPSDSTHGTAKVSVQWDDPGRPRSYASHGNGEMVETTRVQADVSHHHLKQGEDTFLLLNSIERQIDIEVDGRTPADLDKPVVFYCIRGLPVGANRSTSAKRDEVQPGIIMWIEKVDF